MLQIAILSAAPSLDHVSLPSVSGFTDNDLRLIGHTVFRDERDSHSPSSESPEQPAKITKAQLLVVDVNDQFARLVVVKVATQHVAARHPLVGSFRITDLRLTGRNLDERVVIF